MKNRHIIAAALLLLTTTTAAQDRHTETTPDTGENLQTTPNAEQLRQQIETLQRQLDLLEKGRDTLAVKKPALLSDPVEPIANMNGIIPLDTLQTINEAVKIVIYNDNSWKYVRDREFVKDSSIYTKYWDTSTLFPYKEYPLSEMPASLAIDLVDSLKCYHIPTRAASAPNTASAIAGAIRESIFRSKRVIPFMRLSTAGSASRSTTGAVTAT